jgi:hypothetical protein
MKNGEAFVFGRADWEYVLNTFCFGYHIGYKFVETSAGGCNGNYVGIGADDCNRAIVVEQCAPYGLLIVNGEFTSFHGEDPTMVEVLASNRGVRGELPGHGFVGAFPSCLPEGRYRRVAAYQSVQRA